MVHKFYIEDGEEFDYEEFRETLDELFEIFIKDKDISTEKYFDQLKEEFISLIAKDEYPELEDVDFEDEEIYDFAEDFITEEYDYHDCMMNYISRGMLRDDVVKEYNENYPN